MPQFKIEQIALYPQNSERARTFLAKLGLSEWFHDNVVARGEVFSETACENQAHLAFNYQAGNGSDTEAGKPLELEVLDYQVGENWMDVSIESGETGKFGGVSHLGMHVTEEQLVEFDKVMRENDIEIAQRVHTKSHTNPAIKDSRRYKYVIYDTRFLIGVDLKFIVRLPYSPAQ
jgi:hypothetical protein